MMVRLLDWLAEGKQGVMRASGCQVGGRPESRRGRAADRGLEVEGATCGKQSLSPIEKAASGETALVGCQKTGRYVTTGNRRFQGTKKGPLGPCASGCNPTLCISGA